MDEWEYLMVWQTNPQHPPVEIDGECRTFISPERVLIVTETGKDTRVWNADAWLSFMGKPLVRV